jgi:hypothetical protein
MGSGYRTFTAGEVLTASNVQNYLQDQAVMVFGGTAARSSAIGTANFEEGMLTYLTDVDKLQVYTGSSFADVYPAAAAVQGLTFISSTTIGASVSSVSLPASTFTSTYDAYRVVFDASTTTSAPDAAVRIRFRVGGADNTTAASYNHTGWVANPTTLSINNDSSTHSFIGAFLSATPNRFAAQIDLFGVALAKETKYICHGVGMDGGTRRNIATLGFHSVETAFDSMTFNLDSGTMTGGRIRVYGYAN